MIRIKFSAVVGTLCLVTWTVAKASRWPLTTAESSQFTSTTRYTKIMDFIQVLQKQSPYIRVETLARSPEGRKIPLVILGDPVPASPAELKYDKRAVVYVQANIHAGEVEGKEASLMLIRELLKNRKLPYLDKLVVLVCPIFNADGNEKISKEHRKNQQGPKSGVGLRANAQNLDLNRDSMKMESPEMQGLVQNVLMRWDPLLLVDCHTTNGSYHQEPVSYAWPLNPNGDITILRYMRDHMMPLLQAHLREKYDTLSIPHGYFVRNPPEGWITYDHRPRFLTNYIGLRNRLAILIENYAYADYRTRVFGNYHYLLSILDYCHANRNELLELVRKADQKTVLRGLNPTDRDRFAVEYELIALKDPVTIRGWEMKSVPGKTNRPRFEKTNRKKAYVLAHLSDYVPKRSVQLPYAYLIPVSAPKVASILQQHGIVVEQLSKPARLDVQSFQLQEIEAAEKLYQGHRLNIVKGKYIHQKKEFQAGTLCIRTAQPLANLAAYLLEPESDDGLLVWNFFDRYLVSQWRATLQVVPVYKLLKQALLITEVIRTMH